MTNFAKKNYRPCVGIVLVKNGSIFAGQRLDYKSDAWQMPQGGIDIGESPENAAYRELEEETGTTSAEIIFTLDEWLEYNLPSELIGKALGGKFKGQKQKWFVMKFLGKHDEINIRTNNPEFFDWKWIELSKLPGVAVHFKVDIYKKIKEELTSLRLN